MTMVEIVGLEVRDSRFGRWGVCMSTHSGVCWVKKSVPIIKCKLLPCL